MEAPGASMRSKVRTKAAGGPSAVVEETVAEKHRSQQRRQKENRWK